MNAERLRWLKTKCRRLFRRDQQEKALDAELQFHLDHLVAQFRADGISERDARLAAQREFGAEASAYREEIRDTWRPPELADLWRSLRFAMRSLARSPGFTVLAVITLALGVGVNTAMFSALNSIILRPLPYRDTAQLEEIFRTTAQEPRGKISVADYVDLQSQMDGYGAIAAFTRADASLAEPGQPAEFVESVRISANLFDLLGVPPQVGRDFQAGEVREGSDHVLIISSRCWQKRFGGASDIIGRVVRINGQPNEIIGVLPPTFNDWRFLGWVDVFRPLGLTGEESADRKPQLLQLIGRRAGTSAQAAGYIARFGERLAKDFPADNAGSTWETVSLEEDKVGNSPKSVFGMLIGLSGFVLIIACSNLANLLLARTMARAREFAVRSALGASRRQLLRPLVVESLVLALAGGVGAVLVAMWATDWLSAASTGDNGEAVPFMLDWRVLAWAFVASLGTAVAFGLAPALFAMRLDLNGTLKSGARGATAGRGHQRFRSVLIGGQFALAMILLTGAGLFIRGLDDLNNRRAGWQSDQMIRGTILLPAATYPGATEINAFQRLALERLRALPGVASASVSYTMPFLGFAGARRYVVEGREIPKAGQEPTADINGVSPRYFETVGTRLLAGRVFDAHDTPDAPRVFIISETMARGLFGKENALGHRLARVGGDTMEWGQIVGVAADTRSIFPDPHPVTFQLYQPMAQEPRPYNEIAVRTAGATSAALVDAIRTTMTALNPDLPVRDLQPADRRIARRNYQLGVLSNMLNGFAVLGLALASLGIYGVIARTMRNAPVSLRFGSRSVRGFGISLTWFNGEGEAGRGRCGGGFARSFWDHALAELALPKHAAQRSASVGRGHAFAHRGRARRLLFAGAPRGTDQPDRCLARGVD